MTMAIEPLALNAEGTTTTTSANAHTTVRVPPARLTSTVQRLIQHGAGRIMLTSPTGNLLLEISLAMPTSPTLLLRIFDAVDAVAAVSDEPVMVDTLPPLRRSYRGLQNRVTRARLHATPGRLAST